MQNWTHIKEQKPKPGQVVLIKCPLSYFAELRHVDPEDNNWTWLGSAHPVDTNQLIMTTIAASIVHRVSSHIEVVGQMERFWWRPVSGQNEVITEVRQG